MKRLLVHISCAAILTFAIACSDDNNDAGTTHPDATTTMDGTTPDAPGQADATEDGGGMDDAEPAADALPNMDAETPDNGNMMLVPQMEPGDHVQVMEGRIEIGDTFAEVKAKIGAGTRSAAMNTRSYEYTFAGGVELAIWYANTNVDDDDGAPNDVDDTDKVLWVAVSGGFTGKTSKNVGIGSTRAAVEAAAPGGYGPAPHTVDLTAPMPGTLAQYFTTGMLVTYDMANMVRTVTICRAYPVAPDGAIDVANAELELTGGTVRGLVGLSPGSRVSEVTALLGEPDGQGNVVVATQTLGLLSYGFIGIEVFHSITPGLERALFISVHSPYYGTLLGSNAGVDSTRTDVETALGLGMGVASPMNMQFVCYEGGGDPDVAVTYSMDATPLATSFTIPLIRSSMSMSCP